jgi:hypothetical protein
MIFNPAHFSVNPLFYEALSAEFVSETDPLRRARTLGHLTIATSLKGESSLIDLGFLNKDITNTYPVFRYTPSWAPDITSRVDAEWTTIDRAVMKGILLKGYDGRSLSVASLNCDGVQRLQIGHSKDSITYDLELGDKLIVARDAVAEAAKQFFSAS